MNRYDMFSRTNARVFPLLFWVITVSFVETVIIVLGIIINQGLSDDFLKNFVILIKIDLFFSMIFVFLNWRYFLDIIFKSTVVFSGNLTLGNQVLSSKVEACGGAQWELLDVSREPESQVFRIFSDKMSEIYKSNTLLSDMCNGTITFRYMKRSRYIVEII